MSKRVAFLARNDRGTVTIEMALLAPVFATMLIGLVDMGTAFSNKLKMEQVAQRTIEKVQQNGFDATQESTLETEATAAAGTGATADLTYWLECAGTKQTLYTTACTAGQTVARYVQITVSRNYAPIIPATFNGASNSDGTLTARGKAGVRIQ